MPEFTRFNRTRHFLRLVVAAILTLSAIPSGAAGRQMASQAAPPQKPEPQTKPAPPTPIAEKKVELDGYDPWNPVWDRMIERALPRDLVSRRRAAAVEPLCPHFRSMSRTDRRAFWAYFFQALAGAEAGLKPTTDVSHSDPRVAVIDPVTHRIIHQEGLLQLAYADSKRYGCKFNWQRDRLLPDRDPARTILNPRNNLLCGIRIIQNQLIKQHKPLLTASSYWVTLRPETISFRIFLKQMANVPAACGVPLPAPAVAPASEARSSRPARRVPGKPRVSSASPAADPRAAAPAADVDGSHALPEHQPPDP